MNYRHAFHAGNFADVVKHTILTRILVYLMRKDAAFRVIDTHAGVGIYDLSGDKAERTGEWQSGVGRLLAASATTDVVDAHVVICARRAGQQVLTSDAPDLRLLDPQVDIVEV